MWMELSGSTREESEAASWCSSAGIYFTVTLCRLSCRQARPPYDVAQVLADCEYAAVHDLRTGHGRDPDTALAAGWIHEAAGQCVDVDRGHRVPDRGRHLLPMRLGIRCARVGYSRPDCAHEISGDDRTPSLRPQPDVYRCGDGYSWRSRRIPIHSRRRVRGRDAADRSHLRCPLRGTNLAAPIRRVLRGIQENCPALVAANWPAAVEAIAAKTSAVGRSVPFLENEAPDTFVRGCAKRNQRG